MKTAADSARKQTQRLVVLRKRLQYLTKRWTYNQTNSHILQEISALEWAIPLLEAHLKARYGSLLPERALYGRDRHIMVTKLIERDGRDCYLCEKPILTRREMTVDHVVPLSKGGADDITNYKLAHEPCNTDKGNMTLEAYRKQQAKAAA